MQLNESENGLIELLSQLQNGLDELRRGQIELGIQMQEVSKRLVQVEQCVSNHYNDYRQTGQRTVWSDEQRLAFAQWLSEPGEGTDYGYGEQTHTLHHSSKEMPT